MGNNYHYKKSICQTGNMSNKKTVEDLYAEPLKVYKGRMNNY